MTAPRQLAGQPEGLPLTTAPTALGIDVQHAKGHAAQLPLSGRVAQVRRILLVSLDNLGDLVFASALTPPLHAAFPDAIIDVWCKSYTSPVASLIPHVRQVIAADPLWAIAKHGPRPRLASLIRAIGTLRGNRYDAAILSEAPWRTAAAVAATATPIRIGLARHHNARFLTHVLPPEDAHKAVVQEQSRLLSIFGIAVASAHYALDATLLSDLRQVIGMQLPGRFIALHPFATSRDRCVPLAEWTRLASALHDHGVAVLWVGTSAELAELRGSYTQPRDHYSDQLGDGTLRDSAAALSLAAGFVGHDSGPLHVAAAFGVPVVGVFAPGQPDRTFPQGPGPWRVIHRPSPAGIDAGTILREMHALGLFSAV